MTKNENKAEQHGCIVCGKVYDTLVLYAPDGTRLGSTVTSPGGRIVPDAKTLVACNRHSEAEIKAALEKHYPGQAVEDLDDDK